MMEEELGVKVTATRLRRRLSVESEDAKSPSTQSTPTKKRGGRLAAKPQLELIDENATETALKHTRKSTAKDVIEPFEEKAATPSRRSTRIRSNTSTVSETPGEGIEDKPMTPSRRSTRIRSNTSLVAETMQNYDSPRAKRAARRNSQVGSDTEASITPARQTRRTRKDSASSIDKAEINTTKTGSQITQVITEEVETNEKEGNNNDTSKSESPTVRKSPRLMQKTGRKSSTHDNKENQPEAAKESIESACSEKVDTINLTETKDFSVSLSSVKFDPDPQLESKPADQKNLSVTSANLIEQMDMDNKTSKSVMNKSTSVVEDTKQFKSKRHRTKSWTTISVPSANDGNFYSDNEISKKKKKASNIFNPENKSASGDGLINTSIKSNKEEHIDDKQNEANFLTSPENDKKAKRLSKKSESSNQSINVSISNRSVNLEKAFTNTSEIKDNEDNNIADNKPANKMDDNEIEQLFDQAPTAVVQSYVYIEDTDSNTGSLGKEHSEKLFGGDDQCVPVVEHTLNEETSKQVNNDSCEPMDIDVTIPENTSIAQLSDKINLMTPTENNVEEQFETSTNIQYDSLNKTCNKSKRKSSASNTDSQNISKNDDNKSTLVLSQIRDTTNEIISESSLIKNSDDTSGPLSKSVNALETEKSKDIDKKNLSLTYSTSTPLTQKPIKKLGMQINTSIIIKTPNKKMETKKYEKLSSMLSQDSSDSSEHEDEDLEEKLSINKSKIVDDEADEASEDYESGDSRDSEEREYEEENEIHEKGETLNSEEDEYSDDSDYEKGSFIVSSEGEDDELLSGSGDDLSMSADELSMSAKSKKKYNERKNKEQKKASREMFEARHKLNDSDKKTNSKKNKKHPLESSDSESEIIQTKKNRRQRIDSSQDISLENEKSLSKKKKKTKQLSESLEDIESNEEEITIVGGDNNVKEDPLLIQNVIKEEPKTPRKSLDITTVSIREDVEEVKVDDYIPIINPNETTDPLQTTATKNKPKDDKDSCSENEEIMQNYDSILNDLNKSSSNQIKYIDMSLNINKKEKKTKLPVIDQLNLTMAKKSKKKNKTTYDNGNESISKEVNKSEGRKNVNKIAIDEDSSDSIDMKLLFPEDSNDSEVFNGKKRDEKESTQEDDARDVVEDFIPLKRTEAKTNILDQADVPNDKTELFEGMKKNKKRKSSPNISTTDIENTNVSFFIDTTGTHLDEVDENISIKKSAKNNKNKEQDVSIISQDVIDNVNNELDASTKSSVKKNKKTNNNSIVEEINDIELPEDTSIMHSAKKIKNKNNSFVNSEDFNNSVVNIDNANTSLKNSAKKNKKKNNISLVDETNDIEISVLNKSKNSVNNTSILIDDDHTDEKSEPNTSIKNSAKKKKKTIFLDNSKELKDTEISQTTILNSGKKNKLIRKDASLKSEDINYIQIDLTEACNTTPNHAKKHKNNRGISIAETNDNDIVNTIDTIEMADHSGKKKKKNKKGLDTSQNNVDNDISIKSITPEGSGKKKEKTISESDADDHPEEVPIKRVGEVTHNRKRKSSANQSQEQIIIQDDLPANISNQSISRNKKKKRKTSPNDAGVNDQNEGLGQEIQEDVLVKKSTRKNSKNVQTQEIDQNKLTENFHEKHGNIEDQLQKGASKKSKKRKERDEDESSKITKVSKQNSFDKVHVSRLPPEVLKQLDDKPNKELLEAKRTNLISTTSFIVEEAKRRRNKPSNYLEQSVYLDDMLQAKKRKTPKKIPKVLPFIPTASTSDSGFTTKFRINVLPQEPQFVAQSTDVRNFKNEYLRKKRIKKLGTFELYKKQRSAKLSKF